MISKATIRFIRSLHDKKGRQEHQAFIVEGPKLVDELLHLPQWKVEMVYATADWHLPVGIPHPPLEGITEKELKMISAMVSPNKVLALVRMPEGVQLPEAPSRGFHLALDQVQDPGNVGTILRIADWFGIDSVICSPDCADLYNPKVIQAAMGSALRVRVRAMPLADLFIRNAAGARLPVYATRLEGENLFTAGLQEDAIVVMGNESRGIHATILPFVSKGLFIPTFSANPQKAESLNVAIAAGIVCAELRSRGIKK